MLFTQLESIFLEEPWKGVCTEVCIKVNVFIYVCYPELCADIYGKLLVPR